MPLGIAAGSRDELYVADRQTRKIQKLSPEGKVMGSFGSQSNKVGGLNHPESIAVATDRLFVVDTGNHCVQVSQKLFFSLNSLILLILYTFIDEICNVQHIALCSPPNTHILTHCRCCRSEVERARSLVVETWLQISISEILR